MYKCIFSGIIICFSRLLKSFPDKQTIYTNDVKVIKIDYTRFENSRYSILANIRVSSENRGAIDFSIHAHIFLERNQREWLSFMSAVLYVFTTQIKLQPKYISNQKIFPTEKYVDPRNIFTRKICLAEKYFQPKYPNMHPRCLCEHRQWMDIVLVCLFACSVVAICKLVLGFVLNV